MREYSSHYFPSRIAAIMSNEKLSSEVTTCYEQYYGTNNSNHKRWGEKRKWDLCASTFQYRRARQVLIEVCVCVFKRGWYNFLISGSM